LALLVFGLTLSLAPAAAPLPAGPAGPHKYEPTRFTRIKRDPSGKPLVMQKAVVRYVPVTPTAANKGLSVDLIGVVHIGDRDFYEKLNTAFKGYDVVLYEGVKGKPSNKVLQAAVEVLDAAVLDYKSRAEKLGLVPQGKHINYRAPNFVHADVSWDEWGERVQKRGEGWLSLSLRLTADIINARNKRTKQVSAFDLGPQDALSKKIRIAEDFEKDQGGGGLGPTLEMLLIDVRNDACIDVLKREIAAGKRKIAIFYGSGHMPDFERRLMQDFGMRRESVVWHDAWRLTPTPPARVSGSGR
jgi:hypothetical protein